MAEYKAPIQQPTPEVRRTARTAPHSFEKYLSPEAKLNLQSMGLIAQTPKDLTPSEPEHGIQQMTNEAKENYARQALQLEASKQARITAELATTAPSVASFPETANTQQHLGVSTSAEKITPIATFVSPVKAGEAKATLVEKAIKPSVLNRIAGGVTNFFNRKPKTETPQNQNNVNQPARIPQEVKQASSVDNLKDGHTSSASNLGGAVTQSRQDHLPSEPLSTAQTISSANSFGVNYDQASRDKTINKLNSEISQEIAKLKGKYPDLKNIPSSEMGELQKRVNASLALGGIMNVKTVKTGPNWSVVPTLSMNGGGIAVNNGETFSAGIDYSKIGDDGKTTVSANWRF